MIFGYRILSGEPLRIFTSSRHTLTPPLRQWNGHPVSYGLCSGMIFFFFVCVIYYYSCESLRWLASIFSPHDELFSFSLPPPQPENVPDDTIFLSFSSYSLFIFFFLHSWHQQKQNARGGDEVRNLNKPPPLPTHSFLNLRNYSIEFHPLFFLHVTFSMDRKIVPPPFLFLSLSLSLSFLLLF